MRFRFKYTSFWTTVFLCYRYKIDIQMDMWNNLYLHIFQLKKNTEHSKTTCHLLSQKFSEQKSAPLPYTTCMFLLFPVQPWTHFNKESPCKQGMSLKSPSYFWETTCVYWILFHKEQKCSQYPLQVSNKEIYQQWKYIT